MDWAEEGRSRDARLCEIFRVLGLSLRTYQRWKSNPALEDRRAGPISPPKNQLHADEVEKVLQYCCQPEFVDKSPRQIVPILAERGTYIASESTFYRILKSRELLTHRGRARPPRHVRPQALIATRPNQVWSWDITYLRSSLRGEYFYLYLVMDIYSRKILAAHVDQGQSSNAAARLIRKTCQQEGVRRDELFIHSDNGSPMRGSTMLATLQKLGVIPSFSRPRVSNDNAFSESLFKTLKYSALYPRKPFESADQAREWVQRFVAWYNHEHRHSQIAYVTPQSRYLGEDRLILQKRAATYQEARLSHPERWSGQIRTWDSKPYEILNPLPAPILECIQ